MDNYEVQTRDRLNLICRIKETEYNKWHCTPLKGQFKCLEVGLYEVLIHSQCVSYSRWRPSVRRNRQQEVMYCIGQSKTNL